MGLKSKPKKPKTPDYTALAKEQADINQQSMYNQTVSNRANQYGPNGSVNWDVDPATGQWSQTTSMSPENQFMYDMGKGGQLNALNQFTQNAGNPLDTSWMQQWSSPNLNPLSTQGLQGWSTRGTDPISTKGLQGWGDADKLQKGAGFGNVQEVQDAMMRLLQPGLDKRRSDETARLKAMGVTETGEGWKSSMEDLMSGENNASDRALMSSVDAYGDVFNRQLQANTYSDALRKNQLGERFDLSDQGMQQGNYLNTLRGLQSNEDLNYRDQAFQESGLLNQIRNGQFNESLTQRGLPMQDASSIANLLNTFNPGFGSYSQAGMAQGPDIYGAAQQQYGAAVDKYNAKTASNSATTGALLGLAGSAIGSFGGPIGSAVGGYLGKSLAGTPDQMTVGGTGLNPGNTSYYNMQDPYSAYYTPPTG